MATIKEKLTEGMAAPDFDLPSNKGRNIALKDFQGKKNVVLYFYPKDDTPGCTIEACEFRDTLPSLVSKDTVVLGVSPDSLDKHKKFAQKYSLSFPLLSDTEKSLSESYGVWVEKNMYGRKYFGVARTTFVIDKAGIIVKIFEKVKPKGHSLEVKSVIDAMKIKK